MINLNTLLEELANTAEKHDSYAYQFHAPDKFRDDRRIEELAPCDLVEVRVFPGGHYSITPCDAAGRPMGDPKPAWPDTQPFIGQGVSQPPVPPTIREAIRAEEHDQAQATLQQLVAKIDRGEIVAAPGEVVEFKDETVSAWKRFWGKT